MKFELTDVWGFEHAIRGMRNPMNSWNKSDSWQSDFTDDGKGGFVIGTNDMKLAQQLIRAGSEHRKFLRQITVSMDVTAPLYWWKEFDQYRIGVTSNSCSTMHRLASFEINMNCFETDDYDKDLLTIDTGDSMGVVWTYLIRDMENLRIKYNETKDKRYWKELIRILPSSWLQKRTITLNYENIYSMIRQRDHHKLCEWSEAFIDWCHELPYAEEFLFFGL